MLPVLFSIGPFSVYSLSLFLALGFFLGCFIAWRRLKELGLDEEKVLDGIILATIGGFLISRLVFSAENFPRSGFSFGGGLLGFLIIFFLFSRRQKWDHWRILDEVTYAILPFAVLAQVGAFLDGSTVGQPTVMPWGIYFPGSLVRTQPVSLFMVIPLFAIWIFLLRIERDWRTWEWYKSKADGFVFLSFSFLLLLLILLVDFLAVSSVYWFLFKTGVVVAGMILTGIILLYRSGAVIIKR